MAAVRIISAQSSSGAGRDRPVLNGYERMNKQQDRATSSPVFMLMTNPIRAE